MEPSIVEEANGAFDYKVGDRLIVILLLWYCHDVDVLVDGAVVAVFQVFCWKVIVLWSLGGSLQPQFRLCLGLTTPLGKLKIGATGTN